MATAVAYHQQMEIAREIQSRAFHEVEAAYSDTRWERVRAAIFSDQQVPTHARDSMVSRLSVQARGVRAAIEGLLALQKETDGAHSVADLISLLNSSDHDTVVRAVKHIYAVSRNDGNVACKEIIEALIKVSRSGDEDLQRLAVASLCNMSENPNGRMFLFRSGGLAELIRMLGSKDEAIVRYAVTTLHRLLLHIPETRALARQLQATRALVTLLDSKNPKMLAMVTDSIYLLILDDIHERTRFALELDGARKLIRLLTTFEDQPKVVFTAVRCVRTLSGSVLPQPEPARLKHALIERDALIVLYSNLLRAEDSRCRIHILACLRNLSDAVSNEQDHSALIIVLLDIIRGSALAGANNGYSEDEVMYAAGVLSNLTCNNLNNKSAVAESNGVATLVEALRIRPSASDEAVTEPALCALRHCTARYLHAARAQHLLVREGGWTMLHDQLRTLRPPVAKAALGVVRNAALLKDNRIILVEASDGLGQRLTAVTVEILSSAAAELRENIAASSDDGVSMWELAEAAAGALHQLAAHPAVASWLLDEAAALLPIARELLLCDEAFAADDVMQRELLGLLFQLSKGEAGVRQMEGHHMREVIDRCLHSPHPNVVTYAAGVNKNIEAANGRGSSMDAGGYGNPNWEQRGVSEYQTMGSELGEGYEPELFGYHHQGGGGGDNYGLDRIDHSFRMPHNNSDWFDTDL